MSNPFKAAFDAMSGPLFRGQGMADAATFQRGSAPAIPMAEVYVDEGVEIFGFETQVPQLVTEIRLFKRFGIPLPLQRDLITVGSERFRVESIRDQDSSSYLVIVIPEST